jgi:transposase
VSGTLSPQSNSEQIRDLQKRLYWAEMKIQLLEEQLRLERIEKYGPGSEKLSSAQLELLELEPGVSGKEVEAESNREPLPAAESANRPKKHPGRQELPGELTRVERVLPSTPEQCSAKLVAAKQW